MQIFRINEARIFYLIFAIITVLLSCVTCDDVQGRISSHRSHGSSYRYRSYTSITRKRPLTRGTYPSQRSTDDAVIEQIVYGNWGDHCNLFPVYYGIDWNERYVIYGKIRVAMIDMANILSYTVTDSCYIKLVGPNWEKLDMTLESDTNCTQWPSPCSLQILEYTQKNNESTWNPFPLMFVSAQSNIGDCPIDTDTIYDSLAILITPCNEYPDFNFKLTIEVDNGAINGHSPMFTRLLTLLIFLSSVNIVIL